MKHADHGYRVIERPISNFLPQEDGGYLKLGGGLERTPAEFRKFSARDAEVLPRYYDALENVAELLRDLALRVPPHEIGRAACRERVCQYVWVSVSAA